MDGGHRRSPGSATAPVTVVAVEKLGYCPHTIAWTEEGQKQLPSQKRHPPSVHSLVSSLVPPRILLWLAPELGWSVLLSHVWAALPPRCIQPPRSQAREATLTSEPSNPCAPVPNPCVPVDLTALWMPPPPSTPDLPWTWGRHTGLGGSRC